MKPIDAGNLTGPDPAAGPSPEATIGRMVGELWRAIEHGEAIPDGVDPRLVRRVRTVRDALGRP